MAPNFITAKISASRLAAPAAMRKVSIPNRPLLWAARGVPQTRLRRGGA
jgi:hypothetical protein